jgi:hypothetical protein
MKKWVVFVLIGWLVCGFVMGQEFGFDGGEDFGAAAPAVKISGDVSAAFTGFFSEMNSADNIRSIRLGNIFSGSLNFSASASAADAVVVLKLLPVFDGSASPLSLDEAFVRAYFGPVDLEAGWRKLTWGKADSQGPLDVINPLDYSDLTLMTSPQSIKIARPLLHASFNLGSFSKLEAVFAPSFAGHTFDAEGRWAPLEITGMKASLAPVIMQIWSSPLVSDPGVQAALAQLTDPDIIQKLYAAAKTDTLEYLQAGLRFTTTAGSSDIGFQYFFGNLPRPAVDVSGLTAAHAAILADPGILIPVIAYNRYHQAGVDYARVLAGFNLRAEAAVNLTEDLDGADGAVYNPFAAWSLGFDRDLFWGVNLNLQGAGTVRLFDDQVAGNPLADIEAGTEMTSTRITAMLSKTFLRGDLELKAAALWGIEDQDCLIIPAVVWSKDDVSVELSAGIFAGDKSGALGQYHNNNYLKTTLTYRF